jgi:CRP-like cAMP-binding protein
MSQTCALKLFGKSAPKKLHFRHILYRQSHPSTACYLILSGELRLSTRHSKSHTTHSHLIAPLCLGESAFLALPYAETAVVLSEGCEVVEIWPEEMAQRAEVAGLGDEFERVRERVRGGCAGRRAGGQRVERVCGEELRAYRRMLGQITNVPFV